MQSKKELIGKIISLSLLGVDRGTGDTKYTRAACHTWCDVPEGIEGLEGLEGMDDKSLEDLLQRLSLAAEEAASEEFESLVDYVFSVYATEETARHMVLPVGSEVAGMERVEGGWKARTMLFVPSRLPLAHLREIAEIYKVAYPETLVVPPCAELHLPSLAGAHASSPYGFFRALRGVEALDFMKAGVTDALAPYEGEWKCVGIFPNDNKGFTAHVRAAKSLRHEINITV